MLVELRPEDVERSADVLLGRVRLREVATRLYTKWITGLPR